MCNFRNRKSCKTVITIYAMIYTAPCVLFLMLADTLRGQEAGEKWRVFWAREMASSRQVSAIWGPRNSRFPEPNPLPLVHVMYLPSSKTLHTGTYNHMCKDGFMYKSPPWKGLRVQPAYYLTCAYHHTYVCIHICQPEIDQGGEECGKVTLPHCSPTPHQPLQCGKITHHPSTSSTLHPSTSFIIRNQQQTVRCIKRRSGT